MLNTWPKVFSPKSTAEEQRVGQKFSQTYCGHSDRGTVIYGREHLYESPIAFTLPIKLLQLFAQDEQRIIQELEREYDVSLSDLIQAIPLDHQPNPMTKRASFFLNTLRRTSMNRPSKLELHGDTLKSAKARQLGLAAEDSQIQKLVRQQLSAHRNIKLYYETMVQKVEQKMQENMEVGQGPFRRSPEKKDESVQWIPLNCCVQEFLVCDDGHQTNYQTTTVGAAAAHSVGFNRIMTADSSGKAPSLDVFWSKQEQGNNLIRDLRALQEVLTSCATEFNELLISWLSSDRTLEGGTHSRVFALVKEIQFLNDEIISFGLFILHDYLTPLSREVNARHICDEITSLVARMQQIEFVDPTQEHFYLQQLQAPGGGAGGVNNWLTDSKQKIKEVVNYTRDLSGFIRVAIQHECLMTDATFVAGPDWIQVKRTRECCLSQLTTALATSFLAILEDWWSNIVNALSSDDMIVSDTRSTLGLHHTSCRYNASRSMGHIDEEGSPTIESLEILQAESAMTPIVFGDSRTNLRRHLSSASKSNGRQVKPRRNSVQSVCSNQSFASSKSGSFSRKSSSRHPLEHLPAAKVQNDIFWDQLMSLGWLVQIESLLSTQGSELGMLQDYAQAVADVRDSVMISFHCLPMSAPVTSQSGLGTSGPSKLPLDASELAESKVQVSGRRGQLAVSFGLDPLQFSMLPDSLKASSVKIQMLPVLFSQGINEMQTISNLTGKNPIQHAINEEGLRQMQSYVTQYKAWQCQSRAIQAQKEMASTSHAPSRSRSFGPHATRRGGDRSATSIMSNLTSEWDMVSPTKVEPWNGDHHVMDLLNHLEMAILGHANETRPVVDSSSGSNHETSNNEFQITYSPQTVTQVDSVPGAATGILGSMMEYSSSKIFGTRGSKDTDILECAEALTRALGQIKPIVDISAQEMTEDTQWPPKHRADVSSSSCECLEAARPTSGRPVGSLWVTSHVVSCKSAKDRTSMSVTLSQANILKNCHGLQFNANHSGQDDEDDWRAILDAMRSEIGVRIKNVERNLKLGEFAKDLLWISAFGANAPASHQPSMDTTAATTNHSVTQCNSLNEESPPSPVVKDALTLVRPLLPPASLKSTGSSGNLSSSATEESQDDELDDEGVLVECGARLIKEDVTSGSIPIASPTSLDSPPPPLKLVRTLTSPVLEPVMTVDSNSQLSPTSAGTTLSQALDNSGSLQQSSFTAADGKGQYTSFPESFDEQPQLSQLLARSLGLNTFSLSSSGDAEGSHEDAVSRRQMANAITNTSSPPANTTLHRSTLSWSSQQSIYYQHQHRQLHSTQHQQSILSTFAPSSSTPLLKKRISALSLGLGLGLGLGHGSTSKAKNQQQHSPSSSLDSATLVSQPQNLSSAAVCTTTAGLQSQEPHISGSLANRADASSLYFEGKASMKRGKFAFNRVQLKFLPAAYRPPRRMTNNSFES
ncbi:Phosphatidylinositol 3,4,5-trisphosphate-dependent Rac exchanger 2 protein [Podila humilis]|nr:Phosphatidylinositol 3,4,5-trisphosphate-dependent Rac exchanger 2 protein [Podila humilis]